MASLNVSFFAHTYFDGVKTPLYIRNITVPGGGAVPINVDFDPYYISISDLEFAGRITVDYEVYDDIGATVESGSVPQLYTHPTSSGQLAIYQKQAYFRLHNAGDYRFSMSMEERQRNLRRTQQELDRLQSDAVPVEMGFHTAANANQWGGRGGYNNPQSKRICIRISSDNYVDSTKLGGTDFGEDYGRDGEYLPLVKTWVTVNLGAKFAGYTDNSGCTSYFSHNQGDFVLLSVIPLYRDDAKQHNIYLQDLDINDQPGVPLFAYLTGASNNSTDYINISEDNHAMMVYTTVVTGMQRFQHGLNGMTIKLRLGATGSNIGTHVNYLNGTPYIHVKNVAAATRSKFTVGHEFGHAVQIAKLNPKLYLNGNDLDGSDIDYRYPGGNPTQHTMTSAEWHLAAAIEGFGHYVSARVWNDNAIDSGAVYVSTYDLTPSLGDVLQLGNYDQYFMSGLVNICPDPEQCPNASVERDWAQFFWNFQTNAPIWLNTMPTDADMVGIWMDSYTWPKKGGLPLDLTNAAFLRWGFAGSLRFAVTRTAAGIRLD